MEFEDGSFGRSRQVLVCRRDTAAAAPERQTLRSYARAGIMWLSDCELIGSVIGPRGFYLVAETSRLNHVLFLLRLLWLSGDLALINDASVNHFSCHVEEEGAGLHSVLFLGINYRPDFCKTVRFSPLRTTRREQTLVRLLLETTGVPLLASASIVFNHC